MDPGIFEEIGLTPAEGKVYLALLELGSATAGPIMERSGLQSSVVHLTLNRLIDKGFVSYVKEGQRHKYQAADPRHIITFLNEKKERFEGILPQLLAKQAVGSSKPEVTVYRGKRGVQELLYELLEAGGTEHHTLGSPRESLMLPESWWVSYHRDRAKKGIAAKLLFNESLRSWGAESKYSKSEVRYTSKEFEPLTETIIRNDTVGIIMWTEKPIGILIREKTLAYGYEQFFRMAWQGIAEKRGGKQTPRTII
ncbi:MAG: helix-turn-helix domain-containing protein [Nanoarchaeota archaeon]